MGRISGLLDALELYLRTHADAAVAAGNYHRANLGRLKRIDERDDQHVELSVRSVANQESMNDGLTEMLLCLRGLGPWMARIEAKVEQAIKPSPFTFGPEHGANAAGQPVHTGVTVTYQGPASPSERSEP